MKRLLTHPLGIGILSIIILLIPISQYPNSLGPDQGLYLSIAQRLMSGETPYVDYIEINFPMIHYLSIVPHIFANITGLNVILAFNILIALSMGISNYASARFTSILIEKKDDWLVWVFPSALLLVSLSVFNQYELGQREHLVLIVLFPALLWRGMRWHSEPFYMPATATLLGTFVGITATLKPQLLPLAFIPDIYWILSQRKIKPLFTAEVYAFIAVGIVHILYFVLQPELTREFIKTLSFTLEGYGAYGNAPYLQIFLNTTALPVFTLIFVIALLLPMHKAGKLWNLTRPIALMGIFAVFIYLFQQKGFYYHRLPYRTLVTVTIILFVLYILKNLSERRASTPANFGNVAWTAYVIIIVLFAIVQTNAFDPNIFYNKNDVNDYLLAYPDEFEPGETILHIDTFLQSAHPVISLLGLREVATYNPSVPFAFGYFDYPDTDYYDEDHILPQLVVDFLDTLVLDITVKAPKYIVVKKGRCFGCQENFRVFDFLEARGVIQELIAPDYMIKADLPGYIIYERNSDDG